MSTAAAAAAGEQKPQKEEVEQVSGGDTKKNGGNGPAGPEKPIMVARNKTGVVKWFSFKNGYGFITVDGEGEDDIFVHRSEFIKEGAREVFYHVDVGDRLEFDIINRAKGREAVAVTGPNGVRIPGSPAKFGRRRPNSEHRPRNSNQEDHFEDAQQEQQTNGDAGHNKKRGGGRGGGRRRNASGEAGGNDSNDQNSIKATMEMLLHPSPERAEAVVDLAKTPEVVVVRAVERATTTKKMPHPRNENITTNSSEQLCALESISAICLLEPRSVMLRASAKALAKSEIRDAEDACSELNGRDLCGERVIVELSRGKERGPRGGGGGRDGGYGGGRTAMEEVVAVEVIAMEVVVVDMAAEMAVDLEVDVEVSLYILRYGPPVQTKYRLVVENLSTRCSWQDLKDMMRKEGEATYCDAHKKEKNLALVCFLGLHLSYFPIRLKLTRWFSHSDLKRAMKAYQGKDINGRKIKLIDDTQSGGGRSRSRSRSRSPRSRRRRSPSRSKSPRDSRSRSPASRSKSKSRSPASQNGGSHGASLHHLRDLALAQPQRPAVWAARSPKSLDRYSPGKLDFWATQGSTTPKSASKSSKTASAAVSSTSMAQTRPLNPGRISASGPGPILLKRRRSSQLGRKTSWIFSRPPSRKCSEVKKEQKPSETSLPTSPEEKMDEPEENSFLTQVCQTGVEQARAEKSLLSLASTSIVNTTLNSSEAVGELSSQEEEGDSQLPATAPNLQPSPKLGPTNIDSESIYLLQNLPPLTDEMRYRCPALPIKPDQHLSFRWC
uniref:CSD domain-containing protein n=1 Tax=Ditylenchus dipsaci TaxID=166011 RepID=A0A915DDR1_9BILA